MTDVRKDDEGFWQWYDDSATLRRMYNRSRNKSRFIKEWMETWRKSLEGVV